MKNLFPFGLSKLLISVSVFILSQGSFAVDKKFSLSSYHPGFLSFSPEIIGQFTLLVLLLVILAFYILNKRKKERESVKRCKHLENLLEKRYLELSQIKNQLQQEKNQRIKLEKTLEENENRYQALTKFSAVGVWQTSFFDRKTLYMNSTMRHILGIAYDVPIEEINLYDFFSGESLAKIKSEDLEKRQRGESSSYEVHLTRTDGEIRHVIISDQPLKSENGDVISTITTLTDITSQKLTEKALEKQIELQSIIMGFSTYFINLGLNEIDNGINMAMKIVGEFVNADRSYIFQFYDQKKSVNNTHEWCAEGITSQINTLQGLSTSLIPWWMKELEQFETIHIARVSEHDFEIMDEQLMLKRQGIQSLVVVPMINENKLIGFFGLDSVKNERSWSDDTVILLRIVGEIFSNALKHKESGKERENLIKELESKNTELQQFTYTVSHDLKSPLVTIKGFLGLLITDAKTGDIDRMESDISRIVSATDKMHHLLEDLLELSRIGRIINPPQNISMSRLVEDVIELLQGAVNNKAVALVINNELANVYGDKPRLHQVWQNLIENAVKFLGDQTDPKIEIGSQVENDEVFFYVRDNGIGIEAQYQEQIFDLFKKLNPDNEGTGIGLTLVKRIIEVHGGRVWVRSKGPAQGSSFYFSLPGKK